MTAPRIELSVIIPTYGRPASLLRTVRALHGEVSQHGLERQVEIIVADDANETADAEAIEEGIATLGWQGVRHLRLPCHAGASAARNAGVEHSRGDLLAFLDDDIVPTSNYLRATIAFHREYPSVLVVNGNLRPLRDDIYSRFWFYHYDATFNRAGEVYPVAMLASGNCSMKRQVLELECPLFDVALLQREDLDLYLRLRRHGVQVCKCDGILALNDCRPTLGAFLRQYAGYAVGQQHLAAKHGAEVLALGRQPLRPNWRFAHLYLLLRLQRHALLLATRVRRGLERWTSSQRQAS